MAFDGIAISCVKEELINKLANGKLDKIYQPEPDEIILGVRAGGANYRLLLTCNPSFPRAHLTNINKNNPQTAPIFCMVLRKHLLNGKVTAITQPNFDRVLNIAIESFNEMGDLTEKQLIIEVMGKHSNIILVDSNSVVIDSAKHVSYDKSSVRQVLPGSKYSLPPTGNRLDPREYDFTKFYDIVSNAEGMVSSIYQNYFGISPVVAKELVYISEISSTEKNAGIKRLYDNFYNYVTGPKSEFFIYYDENKRVAEFSCSELKTYSGYSKASYGSISTLVDFYYKEKDLFFRVNQKSLDIKKIIENNISRCARKAKLYTKTLADIEDRARLKLHGELITSNIYNIKKGASEFTCQNFYDENLSDITIKLDPTLTPVENAQKYFKKYNKEKRTFEALQKQIAENQEEQHYLNTILVSLNSCFDETDIKEIRDELYSGGYVKKKKNIISKKEKKSKPLNFFSSDGFSIFVGKNNHQNDFLTMKFANGNDIWLHTEIIPGSHVIIKTNNQPVPEGTIFEAASLAAYYSQASLKPKIPVVYTLKKNVKKPSGAKPGMVIYNNYKTIIIDSGIEVIEKIKNNPGGA
ncbi:MAG: NFACT family protein [Clostridiales bacterium]|jgi:predicted ribosome quality control (RQC) complex YloA/Tae2 family protein|nr:NFACT family protein [Clostridiales bacterium]